METPSDMMIVFALAAAVVILVLAVWFFFGRQRSERLRKRFGPEYDLAVRRLGGRSKAEAELRDREQRVQKLHIQPLTPSDAVKFGEAWKVLQARFVDNPREVVLQADHLVRQLMLKRGYPIADFEHCAADISVDHPTVVQHYRAAQAIATRDERDTEQLRKAVVHYRALFDELLEVKAVDKGVITPPRPRAKVGMA